MKTDLVEHLREQLKSHDAISMIPMSPKQLRESKAQHPWADLVVGDFEIRVINREKYGLEPQ
jgi:hypothetical protein